MTTPGWMDDDLDAMLDLEEFAVEAVCVGGTINAVFDDAYDEVFGVHGSAPALWARTSETARVSLAAGQAVSIEGENYIVSALKPDGGGLTVVILEES